MYYNPTTKRNQKIKIPGQRSLIVAVLVHYMNRVLILYEFYVDPSALYTYPYMNLK